MIRVIFFLPFMRYTEGRHIDPIECETMRVRVCLAQFNWSDSFLHALVPEQGSRSYSKYMPRLVDRILAEIG